jgi:hypothetical protein
MALPDGSGNVTEIFSDTTNRYFHQINSGHHIHAERTVAASVKLAGPTVSSLRGASARFNSDRRRMSKAP